MPKKIAAVLVLLGVLAVIGPGAANFAAASEKPFIFGLLMVGPNAINLTDMPRLFCFLGFPVETVKKRQLSLL